MQQSILKISWCNDTHGSMEIILDKFFPCAKKENEEFAENCEQVSFTGEIYFRN